MMKPRIFAMLAALSAFAAPVHAREEAAGDVVDDSTINASVKVAFVSDKTTDASKINVGHPQGVVQLSGFVPTQARRTRPASLPPASRA